ncbi:ligand-dependent nuclear receptor-interacting factor 1-like [Hyla sarda]|uniref:ligand-dependent nuclear receptor-interacting factor 1-like n=1 Tax=Hyla sarda TaxID=327740 RepID=UPI0024C315C7|nr:ligand-dependent nuclear receptor-interacting factor 1-like [Hyla sarda]
MATISHITPSEKPEVSDYYFHIPENAEVKRVPISMLSSSVQQRITRLGDCTDFTNAPYVIVVSPITKQKFPNSHIARMTAAKEEAERCQVALGDTGQSSEERASPRKPDKWMRKDHETYLVPMKCCKDIALTILQLSQTGNGENSSLESELPNISDSLILNLQVIKMKATALCMYKNMMYLLPESIKKNGSNGRNYCQENVEKSEAPESQPGAEMSSKSERRKNGLGCVTLRKFSFLQQQHHRLKDIVNGKSASVVKLQNEDRWDRPAGQKSTCASPSSRPSTENDLQISFLEHSGRHIKRKLSYIGNSETLVKKIHISGSAKKQDSPAAKNAFTHSHLPTLLPSSGSASSLACQEPPPSFFSTNLTQSVKQTDREGLCPSSLLCSKFPAMVPASLISDPSCEDNSRLNTKSSLGLSTFTTSTEDSHEPDETLLHLEPVSSPSLSGFSTSSEDNHEPDKSLLCLKPISSPSLSEVSTSSETSHVQDESRSGLKLRSHQTLSGISSSSEDSHEPDKSLLCLKPISSPSLSEVSTSSETSHVQDESRSGLKLRSHQTLSGISSSSEDSHEPDETLSSGGSSLINHLQSELALFPDIDETTRDERAQRLLDRVRECEKIVEDMREKEKSELTFLSNIFYN